MHAIQRLRKKDPDLRAALARRGGAIDWDAFDAQEERRKQAQQECENAQAQRRQVAEQIGQLKRSGAGDEAALAALRAEGERVAALLPDLTARAKALNDEQEQWVYQLPNAPLPAVPDGKDEKDNRLVRQVGQPLPAAAPDHAQTAQAFSGFEPELASNLSGSRFAVLQGDIAKLHRALIQMMLDMHDEAGYREVYVPYLVRAQTLFGTGQLPKFEDDLFKTQDDLYLIPTAEVPVTNLVAGRVLETHELPLAWCAHTPCFRREAGSAGRDVHGLIRQHQFEKVELVRIEHPNASEQALVEHVLAGAERILQALELPYRVMELCAGDMGFASQHTFDLEVWMPGQGAYREISSCSNMGDFQARRMDVRLKDGKERIFPHTLNGSGLAVGRSLAAVLENHLEPDGRLRLPERLRPYLNRRTHLEGTTPVQEGFRNPAPDSFGPSGRRR